MEVTAETQSAKVTEVSREATHAQAQTKHMMNIEVLLKEEDPPPPPSRDDLCCCEILNLSGAKKQITECPAWGASLASVSRQPSAFCGPRCHNRSGGRMLARLAGDADRTWHSGQWSRADSSAEFSAHLPVVCCFSARSHREGWATSSVELFCSVALFPSQRVSHEFPPVCLCFRLRVSHLLRPGVGHQSPERPPRTEDAARGESPPSPPLRGLSVVAGQAICTPLHSCIFPEMKTSLESHSINSSTIEGPF